MANIILKASIWNREVHPCFPTNHIHNSFLSILKFRVSEDISFSLFGPQDLYQMPYWHSHLHILCISSITFFISCLFETSRRYLVHPQLNAGLAKLWGRQQKRHYFGKKGNNFVISFLFPTEKAISSVENYFLFTEMLSFSSQATITKSINSVA